MVRERLKKPMTKTKIKKFWGIKQVSACKVKTSKPKFPKN